MNYFEEFRKTTTGWLTSAQDSAASFVENASDAFSSVSSSVSSTLNSFEIPSFATPQILKDLYSSPTRKPSPRRQDQGGSGGRTPEEAAAVAALVAATMSTPSDSKDDETSANGIPDGNNLVHLTKKLIEIRSVLLSIDQSEDLKLPSIVVIGSQSSGKSSVLEAIVGHQFLPK